VFVSFFYIRVVNRAGIYAASSDSGRNLRKVSGRTRAQNVEVTNKRSSFFRFK